jgi:hypothetical protein
MLNIAIVFTFLTFGVTLKSCCGCKEPFLGAWEPQIQTNQDLLGKLKWIIKRKLCIKI